MSASEATSPDQFRKRTTADVVRIGEGSHLVTVTRYEGDKRVAGRAYNVKKSSELNPSARGGAYTSGWRVTSGAGPVKPLHPTRKAAVEAATRHFTDVYMGGR